MIYHVTILGTGRVEVAAYGLADAEHLVEKEIARLWPEARVSISEVARPGAGRVVEEFAVSYRVEGTLEVKAGTVEEARSAAYRRGREMLAGSRYHRVEWRATHTVPAA